MQIAGITDPWFQVSMALTVTQGLPSLQPKRVDSLQ
jgi:hypothetical protein